MYTFDIPFLFQGLTLWKPFPAVRLPDTFRKQQPRWQEAKMNMGTAMWYLVILDIPAFHYLCVACPGIGHFELSYFMLIALLVPVRFDVLLK